MQFNSTTPDHLRKESYKYYIEISDEISMAQAAEVCHRICGDTSKISPPLFTPRGTTDYVIGVNEAEYLEPVRTALEELAQEPEIVISDSIQMGGIVSTDQISRS